MLPSWASAGVGWKTAAQQAARPSQSCGVPIAAESGATTASGLLCEGGSRLPAHRALSGLASAARGETGHRHAPGTVGC
jgi:hypothetical protein